MKCVLTSVAVSESSARWGRLHGSENELFCQFGKGTRADDRETSDRRTMNTQTQSAIGMMTVGVTD
jgi:hypothetical protein